jgi:hypothetical protein
VTVVFGLRRTASVALTAATEYSDGCTHEASAKALASAGAGIPVLGDSTSLSVIVESGTNLLSKE